METFLKPRAQASADFYNKVFALFGLALLVTGLGVYAGFNLLWNMFVTAPWSIYLIFIAELGLIFTSPRWSKNEAIAKPLFSLFAFLSGLTIVPILATFAAEFGGYAIIYRAMFATTVMFLALGLVGHSIQKSLNRYGGLLMMALIALIVIGIINIFLPWGNTGEMIYSAAGVLLFGAYAVIDVNRLKHYPEDQAMMAAIALYLNIFNLFIFILRLTGALARD